MDESKLTPDLDSVSVAGSVDTSPQLTREDLLRELGAPSCLKKVPKITVSSRKGDVPDTVEKVFYIGGKKVVEQKKIEPQPEPQEIPSPLDFDLPTEEQKQTPKPAEVTKYDIIFSKIETIPSAKEKTHLQKKGNIEVELEAEIALGFNPYSNLCSSLGFLIQGVHEDIRNLEEGNYTFKMKIEKTK
jgi:hypothetical protein